MVQTRALVNVAKEPSGSSEDGTILDRVSDCWRHVIRKDISHKNKGVWCANFASPSNISVKYRAILPDFTFSLR